MKKIKINKKALIEAIATLFLVLFCLSGWVLFIGNLIEEDKKETEALTNETREIKDSISNQKETEIVVSKHSSFDYKSYIEDLIAENDQQRDSLVYYRMFYNSVMRKYPLEYKWSYSISGNVKTYEGILIQKIRVDESKNKGFSSS